MGNISTLEMASLMEAGRPGPLGDVVRVGAYAKFSRTTHRFMRCWRNLKRQAFREFDSPVQRRCAHTRVGSHTSEMQVQLYYSSSTVFLKHCASILGAVSASTSCHMRGRGSLRGQAFMDFDSPVLRRGARSQSGSYTAGLQVQLHYSLQNGLSDAVR